MERGECILVFWCNTWVTLAKQTLQPVRFILGYTQVWKKGIFTACIPLPNPSHLCNSYIYPTQKKGYRRASLGLSTSIKLTNLKRVHISILLYRFYPSISKELSPVTRCSRRCFQNGGSGSASIPQLPRWDAGLSLASAAGEKEAGSCESVCVFLPSFIFPSFSDLIWNHKLAPIAAAPCVHNITH